MATTKWCPLAKNQRQATNTTVRCIAGCEFRATGFGEGMHSAVLSGMNICTKAFGKLDPKSRDLWVDTGRS